MPFINLAGYKFIQLDFLSELQKNLTYMTLKLGCRGTILLSEEGININLSASAENSTKFKEYLWQYSMFEDIEFKESISCAQPFKYMRVKIKPEIITMHQQDIKPYERKVKEITPKALCQWLDEGKEVTLLDTRNDYEIKFGSFVGAVNLNLQDFGEFPRKAKSLPKDKTIVMFCTGGIRCEKAGLQLLKEEYQEIYQLKGGILQYLQEVGGKHYEGECFVFDSRISVDVNLNETGTKQCQLCSGPILKLSHHQCEAKLSA